MHTPSPAIGTSVERPGEVKLSALNTLPARRGLAQRHCTSAATYSSALSSRSRRRFVKVSRLADPALWPVGPDYASVHSIA